MTSLVTDSRFVYVIGRRCEPDLFVVGSLFHIWIFLFYAPAPCLSVGWRWLAGRMIIFQTPLNYVRGVSTRNVASRSPPERRLIYRVDSMGPTCGLERVL